MRVLVTGGSGFIGSHLVDRLVAQGFETCVLDIKRPCRDDVSFFQVDILDIEALCKAMKNVDFVFHLAAVADISEALKDPQHCFEVNVRGVMNVLEAARLNNVERVVFASTVWVYSTLPQDTVDEETELHSEKCKDIYTASKILAEDYCKQYCTTYNMNFTILRYGIPYGPRSRQATAIASFVEKALRKEEIVVFGDGTQGRSFIFIDDLIEGNLAAMKKIAENKVFNIAGESVIAINEVLKTLKYLVGDLQVVYTEARGVDHTGKHISLNRAKTELGWEPRIKMEEGLKKYIWWKREKAALLAV